MLLAPINLRLQVGERERLLGAGGREFLAFRVPGGPRDASDEWGSAHTRAPLGARKIYLLERAGAENNH